MLPCSSTKRALRSVEKGVFNSRNGFGSRWREKRSSREDGREGARVTTREAREGEG